MGKFIKDYQKNFLKLVNSLKATDNQGKKISINLAIKIIIDTIKNLVETKDKIIFIGNGGSAAIASHMAVDFWKNAGIRAVAFNDPSGLTCISNDFGYKHVFEKPIEMFAESGDILFAISSSGKSQNILQAVKAARKRNLKVITLSGFDNDNLLRKLGHINFYVPSASYGLVEVVHHFICHGLINILTKNK